MLAALGAVTVVTLVVFIATVALGDQRRLRVSATFPAAGEAISSGETAFTITFTGEPAKQSVERNVSIEPPTAFAVRWRGRTIELVLKDRLSPGDYSLRLTREARGAGDEALDVALDLRFRVREPGIAFVEKHLEGERLVALREGERRELATAGRIRDFAVSPGGRAIAVITVDGTLTALSLIDPMTGKTDRLSSSKDVDLGAVAWSTDGQALLVTKRDILAGGEAGVPRTSLVRLSGEFIALIDPDGNPTSSPAWSPDAQSIAYFSPATAAVLVRNLSTRAVVTLGAPRGGVPAWSPDSKRIAFESIPASVRGTIPAQPVLVKAIDGSFERSYGVPGEIWSVPRFLDDTVLVALRATVGEASTGTELRFESLETGQNLRTILLAPGADDVTGWDLDPARRTILYVVRAGSQTVILELDLETGQRPPRTINGDRARWLP